MELNKINRLLDDLEGISYKLAGFTPALSGNSEGIEAYCNTLDTMQNKIHQLREPFKELIEN